MSGWQYTIERFVEWRPFVLTLAIGFGAQIGLFTYLRSAARAAGSGKVVAATGTTSGIEMVSCCTHYLVNLLPVLGATGLVGSSADIKLSCSGSRIASNLAGLIHVGSHAYSLTKKEPAEMKPKYFWLIATILIAVAFAGSWIAAAQTNSLAAKENDEGAVSVSVTPEDVTRTANAWRFAVQFNTHVTPISQDMVAVASLKGSDSEERPIAWEGDPPGGHHRRGVLVFRPMNPMPSTVTLHIRDIGGIANRTFTWSLGD